LFQYQKRYVDLRISNNSSNKLFRAVFLSDSSQNTARNKLFEELFQGITLDDVFDDVTSTKTRNKVQVIKIADTTSVRTVLTTRERVRRMSIS
jgi:hypothetical protein